MSEETVLSDTWRRMLCRSLDGLRSDGHLCDTNIYVAGDVQLRAHAVVLSASSPYFRSLFSSVKQGYYTIRIDHVASDVLVNVLHFIYTGELRIGTCALSELISVAQQLELRKLESICLEMQRNRDSKQSLKYKDEAEELSDGSIRAASRDGNVGISSLTGNWTACNSNEQRFKSPQDSSRTSTPMTPASRTPTPKTAVSSASAQLRTPTAIGNTSIRVATTSSGITQPILNAGMISPRQSKMLSQTSPNNMAIFRTENKASEGIKSENEGFTSLRSTLTTATKHSLLPNRVVQSHADEKIRPFSCPICNRKYGSMKGVNWHLQAHHGISSSSRKHASGTNEKKPQCKICGRFFPQLNYLHLHEKCHRVDAKKTYISPLATIGYHRHQPDESGRYVCKVCGRAFLRSQALGSHMWCHLPHGRYGKRQLKRLPDNDGTGLLGNKPSDCIENDSEPSASLTLGTVSSGADVLLMHDSSSQQGTQLSHHKDARTEAHERAPENTSVQKNRDHAWKTTTESGARSRADVVIAPSSTVTQRTHSSSTNAEQVSVFETEQDASSPTDSIEADEQTGLSDRKKLFGCEYCGREFLYSSSLRAHRRLHTGEKPYTCKTCGKTFKWYSVYSRHNCEQGNRTSKVGTTVVIDPQTSSVGHVNVSIKQEPVDDDCIKDGTAERTSNEKQHTNADNGIINRHRNITANDDWIKPERNRHIIESGGQDILNNGNSQTKQLVNGVPAVISRRTLEQAISSAAPAMVGSSSSSDMPQPIPAGSGDKWSCPICGNVYKSLYFVKNHMRIVHGGMKRYSCPLCNKRFGYSNVLRDHMKLHEMQGQVPTQPVPSLPPHQSLSHHNALPPSSHDWSVASHDLHPPPRVSWATSSNFSAAHQWSPPSFGIRSMQPPPPPPPPLWSSVPGSMSQVWPPSSATNQSHSWPPDHVGQSSHTWAGGVLRQTTTWLGGKDNASMVASVPPQGNGIVFRDSQLVRGVFQCRGCPEAFDSQGALVAHAEQLHGGGGSTSGGVILDQSSYVVCGVDDCPEVYTSHDELRQHRQQLHMGGGTSGRDKKSYPCTYCSRVLYSYGGWKLHEMIHRGEKPLKCKYCPYNARSSANMYSHMQSRHKGRNLLGFGKV